MAAKFPMHLVGRFFVSLVRFFWGVEMASKIFTFSCNLYPRPPFPSRFNFRNTFIARFIGRGHFSVSAILNVITFSQISKTVIRRIAINVVNQFIRPFSSYKKPSQSLSIIQTIINANTNIPIWVNTSSRHSSLTSTSAINFPCKISRFWIIVQKFKNAACCNFIFHSNNMSSQMTLVK